jgi:hypothetical protein
MLIDSQPREFDQALDGVDLQTRLPDLDRLPLLDLTAVLRVPVVT